jgi:hypothetical protein
MFIPIIISTILLCFVLFKPRLHQSYGWFSFFASLSWRKLIIIQSKRIKAIITTTDNENWMVQMFNYWDRTASEFGSGLNEATEII